MIVSLSAENLSLIPKLLCHMTQGFINVKNSFALNQNHANS